MAMEKAELITRAKYVPSNFFGWSEIVWVRIGDIPYELSIICHFSEAGSRLRVSQEKFREEDYQL
jgi:hypothetical protein